MKKILNVLLCILMLAGCTKADEKNKETAGRTDYETRKIDYYDYSSPVPESKPVDNYWFENCLFLGDIRVSSIYNYSFVRDEGADVHYIPGLEVETYRTASAETFDGNAPMDELLMTTKKKNVFLMIGINDLDEEEPDLWIKRITEILKEFRKKHSDSHLYMILPYGVEDVDGVDSDLLPARVEMLRDAMKQVCMDLQFYFIDPSEALENSSHVVKEEYVWDGIRLNAEGTTALLDYISRHTAGEEYVKEIFY